MTEGFLYFELILASTSSHIHKNVHELTVPLDLK